MTGTERTNEAQPHDRENVSSRCRAGGACRPRPIRSRPGTQSAAGRQPIRRAGRSGA